MLCLLALGGAAEASLLSAAARWAEQALKSAPVPHELPHPTLPHQIPEAPRPHFEMPHPLPDLPREYGPLMSGSDGLLVKAQQDAQLQSRAKAEQENISQRVTSLFKTAPRAVLVSKGAKAFGSEFMSGAREGKSRLEKLAATNPLVKPWLDAPQYKRVFVVGTAQSDPDVKQLRAQLKAQGYQVFFYKFCEEAIGKLCASEDVGAFFASAGHAIAFNAKGFDDSQYITMETAAIYKHSQGGMLLVFTPQDLIKGGGIFMVPAMAYPLTPSSDRGKAKPTSPAPKPRLAPSPAPADAPPDHA